MQWFDVDPCYVFHPLNAYDDNGTVVFDVCRISEMWRTPGEFGGGTSTLHRWRFDLASGTTTEEMLHDEAQDFPRVADARVGLAHRYGYTAFSGRENPSGRLFQHDLQKGSVVAHDFGLGTHPGEGVFVPAEGSAADDEGWLLTYVHDETTDTSEFVILDASNFAADPVARVPLPQRVPYGFHGSWFDDRNDY